MKYCIVLAALFCAGVAQAEPSQDFVFFDAQIAALQHRIDAGATTGKLNPEALQAVEGKQQELVGQEAKLKAAGTMTVDEKAALGLSIRQQQQRVGGLLEANMPAMRHVDPASVPAPTYVTPTGTTVSAAPGTTPDQNGIVQMQAPAMTVTSPTVPVIHAPMPVTAPPAQQ
jgi:hypothetical protein